MTKYKNIFRVESARLKVWDYSNPWWYYVTINSKDHLECLGEIVNQTMFLSELGAIVEKCWKEIPIHFSNIELDYFVIMPNHIHGIIIINPVETPNVESISSIDNCKDVACNVSTYSKISPKKGSLSSAIRSFKSAVAKNAHQNGYSNFSWQPRFYDRIIRNEKELYKIRKYILQNPLKWDLEKNTPENVDF